MRGDQFARQWRIIRGIKASPEGLIIAEIDKSPYPFKFKTLPSSRKGAKAACVLASLAALRELHNCGLRALARAGHAKAQRAPREIFGISSPSLKIFSVSQAFDRKTSKENFFANSWRLGGRFI